MVPFESFGMVSYSHSIVTMAVSCIIFLDIARYRSQIAIFPYPSAFEALLGGFRHCHNVWYRKNQSGVPTR